MSADAHTVIQLDGDLEAGQWCDRCRLPCLSLVPALVITADRRSRVLIRECPGCAEDAITGDVAAEPPVKAGSR